MCLTLYIDLKKSDGSYGQWWMVSHAPAIEHFRREHFLTTYQMCGYNQLDFFKSIYRIDPIYCCDLFPTLIYHMSDLINLGIIILHLQTKL